MKLNLKGIFEVFEAIKEYVFPYEKLQKRFNRIRNLQELENFIKERSAFVTQTTLYGYLKTRMGLKYTMMFSDDIFLASVNKSKWNIFAEAVGDLTLYSFSYLSANYILNNQDPKEVYEKILDFEETNGMPSEIIMKHKNNFQERLKYYQDLNYYKDDPFKNSGQALYNWSPIADELKVLDKEIVLNSIKNKWKLVVSDFLKNIKEFKN